MSIETSVEGAPCFACTLQDRRGASPSLEWPQPRSMGQRQSVTSHLSCKTTVLRDRLSGAPSAWVVSVRVSSQGSNCHPLPPIAAGPPRKGCLGWWVSLCVLFAHSFAETLTKPAISAVCLTSLCVALLFSVEAGVSGRLCVQTPSGSCPEPQCCSGSCLPTSGPGLWELPG